MSSVPFCSPIRAPSLSAWGHGLGSGLLSLQGLEGYVWIASELLSLTHSISSLKATVSACIV